MVEVASRKDLQAQLTLAADSFARTTADAGALHLRANIHTAGWLQRRQEKDAVMTTQNLTNEAFQALGAPTLVYVRPISAADFVASGVPATALQEFKLAPEQVLYALHSADGVRLAVLADKSSAYAAALAHELAPVSVH